MEIRNQLINILLDCEVAEKDIYDCNFIEHGILESMQIAEIIMEIEELFCIEIDGDDIVPENLVNLESIVNMVLRYKDSDKSLKVGETKEEIMWDMVARKSLGDNVIKQSGWCSSFTGDFFSEREMKEYAENVLCKLTPYLNEDCVVLEVGIASGITARCIAPHVKEYIGIDISSETLKMTKESMEKEGYKNIKLLKGEASIINKLGIEKVNIVIINSVAQYFIDYEAYKDILQKASNMIQEGVIFVGDILDLNKKKEFLEELKKHKGKANNNDLWYSRNFMKEVSKEISTVQEVLISDKEAWTIANELTKYRYDVIYKIGVKNDKS